MKSLRSIVALATLTLSLPVFAVPTTTTYDFNSQPTGGTTGMGTVNNAAQSAYGTNGSVVTVFGNAASLAGLNDAGYFGNSATFTAGGIAATVTAWASTGTGSTTLASGTANSGINSTVGMNGTIQNGVLTAYQTANGGSTSPYNTNGYSLSETSRNTNGGNGGVSNATGNHDFTCTGSSCTPDNSANNNQHAVDNSGAYETLLFSFAQAVTLSTVTLGFPTIGNGASSSNSDLTVLYCKTTATLCAPSTFAGKTFADLVTGPNANWGYTNLLNLSTSNDTGSVGVNYNSKLWMVGAYIADLPGQAVSDGADYVKIRALTICSNGSTGCATVPEPGSIALFGIAGGALWFGRRRRLLAKA